MRKAFEWRKNIELVDFVADEKEIDPVERVSTVEKLEIKKTYNWMDLNEFERKKKKYTTSLVKGVIFKDD